MLLTLPVVAFLLLWGGLSTRNVGSAGVDMDRARPAFLASAAVWGAYLALSTELLSLFHQVTTTWLVVIWVIGILMAVALVWRTGILSVLTGGLRRWIEESLARRTSLAYAAAALLVGILLVVAWISPPNNNDSLLYHMSRVAHWQQNASLAHYPAAYNTQLWAQIWAETAILHFKLLLGSDQASGLVQWFSMLGSILGAGAVAGLLGVRRRGQWLTAAFAFSLPLGILESTSTQNDYVAAFWMISFAYFVILAKRRHLSRLEWISMAASLGLGVLTKATIYLYAFPFAIWFFVPEFFRGETWPAIRSGVGVALTLAGLNIGYWVRDIVTFGGLFGSGGWTQSRIATDWPGQIIIGPMRQILLNAATPSQSVTRLIVKAERSIERLLGVGRSPFELTWAWNNEDYAGNPVHVAIVGVSLLVMVWLWWRHRNDAFDQLPFKFAAVTSFSFLLFSWISFFAAQNIRYQVPAFILFAPVFGYAGEKVLPRRWLMATITFLAVFSLPWILFNQSRPVVSWRPRTRVNSVFVESRQRLLFANWPELQEPYTKAADLVRGASCRQIGLVIDSHDKEYLLWSVLGAPEGGMRVEVLDPLSASSRYLDPTFEPCAVMCTICGTDRTEWGGLPLAADFDVIRVFSR